MLYFLEFMFYLAYKTAEKGGKNPLEGALIYMLLFLMVIFIPAYVLFEAFMERLIDFDIHNVIISYNSTLIAFFIFSFNFFLLFFFFIRRDITYFEKYSNSPLNFYIKPWMLIPLPFIILFLGLTLRIYLFGGEIFGSQHDGWV